MCQTFSRQVHGYYIRTVQDLAWSTYSIKLEIRLCRFVCTNTTCSRRTFAERLGEQLPAYARRTTRCKTRLQAIGLALGGKAGVRLAQLLGISVSADTLLRLIRSVEIPERKTPEVLGVDDFALRKGEQYGTILVDLQRSCPVDLLPDREKATLAAWLKAHPGVQVVSRDRASAYTEAVREAAPHAVQVADRFHLSQNLGETLERILRRFYPTIKQILGETNAATQLLTEHSLPFQRHEADKQVSQQRRMAVYEHILALHAQGYNQTEITEQLQMSRKTVRQAMKGPPQPPIYKQRSTKLALYKAYLTRRFSEEGCDNSLQLYREMRTQGYDGCSSVVTTYLTQLRQQAGVKAETGRYQTTQPKPLKEKVPAPSQMRWWFLLPVERLSARQQEQRTRLCQSKADFALLYQLAQTFVTLLHQHSDEGFSQWLEQVQSSGIEELASFAKGMMRDEAAVRAGLCLKWNQGPVEGAVNRLKLIKRSMYGRAKFDLLRTRVLCVA
jgi:transposase